MILDAFEDPSQPCFGIYLVHLGGLDKRICNGCKLVGNLGPPLYILVGLELKFISYGERDIQGYLEMVRCVAKIVHWREGSPKTPSALSLNLDQFVDCRKVADRQQAFAQLQRIHTLSCVDGSLFASPICD